MPVRTEPEGRWMRLESVVGRTGSEWRGPVGVARRHTARKHKDAAWAVFFPGFPKPGERIAIRKASGGLIHRYVVAVVQRRETGSVVTVSRGRVQPQEPARASAVPTPSAVQGPPPACPRNPRVCSECEGPCRVGAGLCDGCKGA